MIIIYVLLKGVKNKTQWPEASEASPNLVQNPTAEVTVQSQHRDGRHRISLPGVKTVAEWHMQ